MKTSPFKNDGVLLTVLSQILTSDRERVRKREREGGGGERESERDRQTKREKCLVS